MLIVACAIWTLNEVCDEYDNGSGRGGGRVRLGSVVAMSRTAPKGLRAQPATLYTTALDLMRSPGFASLPRALRVACRLLARAVAGVNHLPRAEAAVKLGVSVQTLDRLRRMV